MKQAFLQVSFFSSWLILIRIRDGKRDDKHKKRNAFGRSRGNELKIAGLKESRRWLFVQEIDVGKSICTPSTHTQFCSQSFAHLHTHTHTGTHRAQLCFHVTVYCTCLSSVYSYGDQQSLHSAVLSFRFVHSFFLCSCCCCALCFCFLSVVCVVVVVSFKFIFFMLFLSTSLVCYELLFWFSSGKREKKHRKKHNKRFTTRANAIRWKCVLLAPNYVMAIWIGARYDDDGFVHIKLVPSLSLSPPFSFRASFRSQSYDMSSIVHYFPFLSTATKKKENTFLSFNRYLHILI